MGNSDGRIVGLAVGASDGFTVGTGGSVRQYNECCPLLLSYSRGLSKDLLHGETVQFHSIPCIAQVVCT